MVRKKLLESPNMFDGANCILMFDVDQEMFGSREKSLTYWCIVSE